MDPVVASSTVRFTLNGGVREVDTRPGESLLDLLRGPCGITSPKRGCQPQGQCGACVVLVDGQPQSSCTVSAAAAEGRDVLTVEGLDAEVRAALARVFTSAHALQCGFCTPGIL